MDRKKPQSPIELPRRKSKQTKVLMTWVEPAERGARARVHVVIEEQFDVDGSYESVRSLLCDKKDTALKLT